MHERMWLCDQSTILLTLTGVAFHMCDRTFIHLYVSVKHLNGCELYCKNILTIVNNVQATPKVNLI